MSAELSSEQLEKALLSHQNYQNLPESAVRATAESRPAKLLADFISLAEGTEFPG